MLLLISSNSCSLNLLLVRNHQEEIIIVKRLVQERNNVIKVELRSRDQGSRKNEPLSSGPRCPLLTKIFVV